MPVRLSSISSGTQNAARGVLGGMGRLGMAKAPTDSFTAPDWDLCSARTTLKKCVGTATAVGTDPAQAPSLCPPRAGLCPARTKRQWARQLLLLPGAGDPR